MPRACSDSSVSSWFSCSLAENSTCKSGQIDKAAAKGKGGGQAGQEEQKASAPASGDGERELKPVLRLQSYFCPGQMHVHGDGRSACAAAHAMQEGPASRAV